MTTNSFVTLGGRLSAEALRGRRVRLSAELRPRAAGTAAIWLRVDSGQKTIDLANTMMDEPLRGTADWTSRQIVLPIPAEAQQVVLGMQLLGGGEVDVRRFRVEVLPALAADAPVGPAARAELDSAIAIARRHSLWRDTVSWAVAESAARARAAGAETARDAYPAIRLLLSRLGDHHSFLMGPQPVPSERPSGRPSERAAASLAANPTPIVRPCSPACARSSATACWAPSWGRGRTTARRGALPSAARRRRRARSPCWSARTWPCSPARAP